MFGLYSTKVGVMLFVFFYFFCQDVCQDNLLKSVEDFYY